MDRNIGSMAYSRDFIFKPETFFVFAFVCCFGDFFTDSMVNQHETPQIWGICWSFFGTTATFAGCKEMNSNLTKKMVFHDWEPLKNSFLVELSYP